MSDVGRVSKPSEEILVAEVKAAAKMNCNKAAGLSVVISEMLYTVALR